MTRDHYKGSKKTRDVRVDQIGRLKPLEKGGGNTVLISTEVSSTIFGNAATGATLEATGLHSIVYGCALDTSIIRATDIGSKAGGSANGTGTIEATGEGSISQGKTLTGRSIISSGAGAWAFGFADTADISASVNGAIQFGPGTNSTANSLQVGGFGGSGVLLSSSGSQVIRSGDDDGTVTSSSVASLIVIDSTSGNSTVTTEGVQGVILGKIFTQTDIPTTSIPMTMEVTADGGFVQGFSEGGISGFSMDGSSRGFMAARGKGAHVIGHIDLDGRDNCLADMVASGDGSSASGDITVDGDEQGNDPGIGEITAAGIGARAGGSVFVSMDFPSTGSSTSKILSTGLGSSAYGIANVNGNGGGLSSIIQATSDGCTSYGSSQSGGLLTSEGFATHVRGAAKDLGVIRASGTASFAGGYANKTGNIILSSGFASIATGIVSSGTDLTIEATSSGAWAHGYASSFDLRATARCAFAFGRADTADIEALQENCVQYGPGTNNTAGSLQVGGYSGGVMIKANGQFGTENVALTLGSSDTTFVTTSNCMSITGDGGANTVATITGGISGQELVLIFQDALVTITDTGSKATDTVSLSASFTGADRTLLKLMFDGTSWYEISRSVN